MIPAEQWTQPWLDSGVPHEQGSRAAIDLARWKEGDKHAAFDALFDILAEMDEIEDFTEVGCGCGYNSQVLAEAHPGCCYRGVDISTPMLEYAEKNFGVKNTLLGNAQNLPFEEGECRCVMLAAVIQHVPDWRKAVSEASRVSSRYIILHRVQCTTETTNEFVNPAYGVRLPTRENNEKELLEFCESMGLKLLHPIRWGGRDRFNASYLFEKHKEKWGPRSGAFLLNKKTEEIE